MMEMDCPSSMDGPSTDYEEELQGEFQADSVTDNSPNDLNALNKEVESEVLGMEFSSCESAYEFYCDYGGKSGFNVRKHTRTKNRMGLLTRVVYTCSKQGYRKVDKRCENVSYSQPIFRVGCQAQMICLLQKNGKFKVIKFEKDHNHSLIKTPMKHMLRINRSMSEAQKAHANDAEKAGLPIKATVDLMSIEVGGRENLGFMSTDYKNYIHSKRKTNMEKGDAGAILQYFQKMHADNSSYFYSIQLDEDDMITNIFWADPRCVSDYNLFGDVVCFDTTYQTNEYGRPFAPFIGVNHHKQTVIFGAALLYDETTCSFQWLFETFLSAMSGKQPKTILTDQSAAMANAISKVFPESHHRLCVWHIYQNAAKHLSHVFHRSDEFDHDFSTCIYDYEDEDEWLSAWNNMLAKYSLEENTWLDDLFKLREKWALVYGRHTFTADMKTTQRSESMNNVLKKYLKPKHNFLRFFDQYDKVLSDRRYEELIADFQMMHTLPVLLVSVEILRHAAEVYTPKVFKLFQEEYKRFLDCSISKVGKSEITTEYRVSCGSRPREHLVKFKFEASNQTITVDCSCMKFTFVGILCAHAIKVLDKKNVKRIPSSYILKRWTRGAKARSIIDYHAAETHENSKESIGKRYSLLCRNFREIASFAAEHEKLTEYAHKQSIEMLKGLEEIKRSLHEADCTSVGPNVSGNQHVEPNTCATTIVCGVRTKPTVGRPSGRYKGVLEKKKGKSQAKKEILAKKKIPTKNTKPPPRKKIAFEKFAFTSENQQKQESTTAPQPQNQAFHTLPQGSYATNGVNFSYSDPTTFDGIPSWQHNISFTRLLHESLPQFNFFSQDKGGEGFGT